MRIVVAAAFGETPDDPAELIEAFAEAEWLETWRAGHLAHEILIRLFKQ